MVDATGLTHPRVGAQPGCCLVVNGWLDQFPARPRGFNDPEGSTARSCHYVGMPRFFEKDGFRFFFYNNEHVPIHVHVRYGDGEAVFWIGPTVELRKSQRLKVNELARAEKLAEEHRDLIVRSWNEHCPAPIVFRGQRQLESVF